jgi:hypothetical protein
MNLVEDAVKTRHPIARTLALLVGVTLVQTGPLSCHCEGDGSRRERESQRLAPPTNGSGTEHHPLPETDTSREVDETLLHALRFEDVVSESVLREVLEQASEDHRAGTPGAFRHPEDWNIAARWAALGNVARQRDEQERLEYWRPSARYWPWRNAIVEVARAHLSDPERLWATYQRFKPIVVEHANRDRELARQQAEQIRATVLPAFAESPPPEGEVDPYVLGWRHRRHAEGGDALVAAWRRVFLDLAETLERSASE